jgi:hypothetical protein
MWMVNYSVVEYLTDIQYLPYAVLTAFRLNSWKEVSVMNRILLVASAILLTSPLAGMAQSTAQTASLSAPITAHDVHNLIKSAHTVAEYKELSGYFHQQEAEYRAKAADEKVELDRRAQVNAGLYQKYPRPVDSAQSLYESYLANANGAALEAQHYDQLAAGEGQHDRQLATSAQGKP